MQSPEFCHAEQNGLKLFVRLTPRAVKDSINNSAEYTGKIYLNVQIRAVPEDGKANKALIKFLSKSLKMPMNRIEISHGQKNRFKQLKLYGNPADLQQKLLEICC